MQATLEWLWRGRALQAAHTRRTALSYALLCAERAEVSLEIAGRILHPSSRWAASSASYIACSLLVESIGWSLRAAEHGPLAAGPGPLRAASSEELAELVSARSELMARALPSDEERSRITDELIHRRFESQPQSTEGATLAAQELYRAALALRRQTALTDSVDEVSFQRGTRVGLLLAVLAVLLASVSWFVSGLEARADISRGKPWKASSLAERACESPQRDCDPRFFFHTKREKGPWLEVDLGAASEISAVRVLNRTDCCQDRALPLVVEVSTDHERWQEVARRKSAFTSWKGRFPSTRARWVRFRVAGDSYLHLSDIRVLP